MDFIERMFGISPDAGSGVTEWAIFLVVAMIAALLGTATRRWKRVRQES